MAFFNQAVTALQSLVVAIGAILSIWGGINLLEGYGGDNPGAKSQGAKQFVAGAGVALIGTTLIPLLTGRYLKTREIYATYKKSGYARKFLVEHEQEILIHRAAKQAFDERKLTKLPTVQMLQTEYEALMTQRKKDYAEYRDAKNEMRELLTVRANVERILNEPMEQRDEATQKKQER